MEEKSKILNFSIMPEQPRFTKLKMVFSWGPTLEFFPEVTSYDISF